MNDIEVKRAVQQLQSILGKLGKYGGRIELSEPNTWKNLSVEIIPQENDTESISKSVSIGLYHTLNGIKIYDPLFSLLLLTSTDESHIIITRYTTSTFFGTMHYYCDLVFYSTNLYFKKDRNGIKKEFANFLQCITVDSPYLTAPSEIIKYDTKDCIEQTT